MLVMSNGLLAMYLFVVLALGVFSLVSQLWSPSPVRAPAF